MRKKTFILDTIQFLATISFILWLGSYVTRHIIIYQLFEPINLDLRALYNIQSLQSVFNTVLPAIVLNLISYFSFLMFFIIYLFSSKVNLKREGWLFLIVAIIAVTMPFEIYLSTIDYKIVQNLYSASVDTNIVLNLIRERLTKLSSFSLIEIFSFIAVVYLSISKPLKSKNEN